MNILFLSQTAERVYLRQTPGESGRWSTCRFSFSNSGDEYDWVVVHDNLKNFEEIKVPKSNTLLITAEPETIKTYDKDFVRQFEHVITCQRKIPHPSPTFTAQGLPWMIGLYPPKEGQEWYPQSYDDFKKTKIKKSKNKISAIISNKAYTTQHKERLAFVTAFKKAYPDLIDVYGVGIKKIPDKWHGIAPYKYHLVLENSSIEDYWTEKLSDAFLGEAFPFYAGCPNIEDYFSKHSYTPIDLKKPKESIEIIRNAIEDDLYSKNIKAIKKAKNLVLDQYNIFTIITDFINQHQSDGTPESISIRPQDNTSLKYKVKQAIKNRQKTRAEVDPVLKD